MMAYKKGLIVFFLLIVALGGVFASDDLLQVETEHFTIIYDESCKEGAALIANCCEDTYNSLCSLFKVDPDLHLPVIMTTKTKVVNAYFTASPSNHIMMYDVIADKGSLSAFSETLTSIFKHELTHAFTMNLRSSFWQVLANIFGDPINISNFIYSYQSMTEGIAVTTESLDGYGRMNDLYSYRIVYQAKLENKFPSWLQISGARDTYPSSLLPYIFGGAFLTYLCDTYGTDVVYDLFVKFGKINWFKDTAGVIEKTIGVEFDTLWENFYNSIEVPENFVDSTKLVAYKNTGLFNGIKALSNGSVVFRDGSSYSLYTLNSDLSKSSKLLSDLTTAEEYDVTEDGSKILIPYILEETNFVKVLSKDGKVLKTFNFTDRDARGGVFTQDGGVLLYVAREQETFLERYDSNYEFVSSVSLGYGAIVSSLTNCKDGRIAFIYTLNGADSIALLNTEDLSIELYESPLSMRIFSLSLSYETEESLLSFEWFPTVDAIQKDSPILGGYGEFILEDGSFRLSKANVSGGVNSPLRLKDTVLFSSDLFEGAVLSTISITALSLEEKIYTSHAALQVKGFDSSKLEILENSKKYKAFENMNCGALYPAGTYLDGSAGTGLLWSVTDPTGQYSFNMTGFYDKANTFSLGVWGTDNLTLGPVLMPVTVGGKLSNDAVLLNLQIQPSYTLYFDAGKYIQVADQATESLVLSDSGLDNSFNNIFAVSYTNATKTGLGLNSTLGYRVQFTLKDFNPSLTAQVHIPVFKFGITLATTAQYEVKTKSLELLGSGNINLFNLEIQDGTRILGLYIKRFTIDAQYDCTYKVEDESLEQVVQLRLYATLAPMLGALGSAMELKLGVVLTWNPAEGTPKISFTLIQ